MTLVSTKILFITWKFNEKLNKTLIQSGGGTRPYEARQPSRYFLKRC
jgi:hypothetical protein